MDCAPEHNSVQLLEELIISFDVRPSRVSQRCYVSLLSNEIPSPCSLIIDMMLMAQSSNNCAAIVSLEVKMLLKHAKSYTNWIPKSPDASSCIVLCT